MKEATNKYMKFWFEDDILYSIFIQDIDLNLENCIECIHLRHEISEGKKQYWLYDLNRIRSLDRNAKEYLSRHGQDYLYASAILVNSHFQKFLISTFLKVKKPKIPTHIFTSKQKAIDWLLTIKNSKNESDSRVRR
jgi:hypothetical protein